jgi:hypothetical protein
MSRFARFVPEPAEADTEAPEAGTTARIKGGTFGADAPRRACAALAFLASSRAQGRRRIVDLNEPCRNCNEKQYICILQVTLAALHLQVLSVL